MCYLKYEFIYMFAFVLLFVTVLVAKHQFITSPISDLLRRLELLEQRAQDADKPGLIDKGQQHHGLGAKHRRPKQGQ